jgi:hypothetical protein
MGASGSAGTTCGSSGASARSARGSSSTSRGRQRLAAVGLLAGLWLGPAGADRAAAAEPAPPADGAALAHENRLLQRQLDLASGSDFYLLLDARDRSLRVMLQGVTLRKYEVRQMQLGVPRMLFRKSGLPEGWQDRVWSDPTLEPPRERDRLEIIATGDSTTTPEPPIPLTPEEAFPAPPHYRIRYAGGLALDIRSETVPATLPDSLQANRGLLGGLRARLREARAVLSADTRDELRVQVVLRNEDAAAIYRSLPPGTKLLLLVHAGGP